MLDSFFIGNCQNNEISTGVTVILSKNGAVGGVSVRGKAPATRETDLLKSENSVEKVNAVVLSGGSAFGLEAACGVVDYLKDNNIGYCAGKYNVPIVVGASLYDLEYGQFGYPDKSMGYEACNNLSIFSDINGSVGAGCGATVGKLLGMEHSSKSGLGVKCYKIGNIEIGVVVAVNAFGNVYKRDSNELISGCMVDGVGVDIEKALIGSLNSNDTQIHSGNTTIACIVTNAKLTKTQCNALADGAHDAYARCIRPVHTMVDGDCIFLLSSGEVECNPIALQTAINDLLCQAIENSSKLD